MSNMSKPHAVAALIDTVKATNRWSNTDIVDNASRRGYPMSTSNISRLHNEAIKSLVADTVRGLAAGLDVSPRQVVTAFLRSMDLPVDDEPMSVEEALRKELYPQKIRHMVLDMLARYRA
jgi:hypothetical protein